MVAGCWLLGSGSWFLVPGCWLLVAGLARLRLGELARLSPVSVLVAGFWMQVAGYRTEGDGFRAQCSG